MGPHETVDLDQYWSAAARRLKAASLGSEFISFLVDGSISRSPRSSTDLLALEPMQA